jgi:2-oxoglutarate dehydrogenase E2 component (dihydrolipoamide succinyltransferase)
MPIDITVPSPGESISEVTLGTWAKTEGDWVEKDDLLVEIESDKATLELLAPASGVLKLSAKSGSEQKVGAVIGSIDEKAARSAAHSTAEPKPAERGGATASAAAPSSGAGADVRATSMAKKIAAEKGVSLSAVSGTGPAGRVMKADVLAASDRPAAGSTSAGALGASGTASGASPAVSPAASPSASPSAAASIGTGTSPKATSTPMGSRGVRREKMTKLRQRIAERLVEAQHTAAMLTTFNEADMSEIMRLRAEHKDAFEKEHGVGLGFMSFFVKAATSALRKYPRVNAYILGGDSGPGEIEFHDYCDVAVAVGTDRGLVVPVLRNAEALSFAGVERTIKELALKARDGKLTVNEMTGGTFTISNGGVYGSLMSTPILNPPQSAILGMHAIKKRPIEDAKNPGQIVLRPMMYLALSYDHRIIDGAEAVGFLVHIKDCVERPERLLFG